MRAVAKFYVIPLIFFIASVALIYYVKPESRERIESIPEVICQNVTETYYVLELVNRTPNYSASSTLARSVGENTSTYIGRVNISNLEDIPAFFSINYTFHVIPVNGSARDDKFYANISVDMKKYESIPFYDVVGAGDDVSGSFVITPKNISRVENTTKTNTTQKCF